MSQKENFVFYADWIDVLKAYDAAGKPELAGELAKQIVYYGVTKEMTSNDPIITGLVSAMCVALIEKSKNRYHACMKNGQRGGRPRQYDYAEIAALHDEGFSDDEIAEQLGCNLRTVQRALSNNEDEI